MQSHCKSLFVSHPLTSYWPDQATRLRPSSMGICFLAEEQVNTDSAASNSTCLLYQFSWVWSVTTAQQNPLLRSHPAAAKMSASLCSHLEAPLLGKHHFLLLELLAAFSSQKLQDSWWLSSSVPERREMDQQDGPCILTEPHTYNHIYFVTFATLLWIAASHRPCLHSLV